MEDPQPLPQPELPLCDSLIIWVSVVPCLPARPRAGRAGRVGRVEHGTSGCHVRLLRSLCVPDSGSPRSYTALPLTGGQEALAASVPRMLSIWAHTAPMVV